MVAAYVAAESDCLSCASWTEKHQIIFLIIYDSFAITRIKCVYNLYLVCKQNNEKNIFDLQLKH